MVQRAQLLKECAWLLHLTGDKASHGVDVGIGGRIVPPGTKPWMYTGGSLSRVRYLLTLLTGNREAEQWAYDAPNWIYVPYTSLQCVMLVGHVIVVVLWLYKLALTRL